MRIGSALLAIFIFDPNSKEPFFTYVARHQSRLIAGLVVAFGLGMLWRGATAAGGFAAILTGVVVSYGLLPLYAKTLGQSETVAAWLGTELNFFHAVFVAAICATIVHILVSKKTQPDPAKAELTWHGLGLISKERLTAYARRLVMTVVVFAILGACMARGVLKPSVAAMLGAGWTLGILLFAIGKAPDPKEKRDWMTAYWQVCWPLAPSSCCFIFTELMDHTLPPARAWAHGDTPRAGRQSAVQG